MRLSTIITSAAIAGAGALFARQVRGFWREVRHQQLLARLAGEPVKRIVVVGVGFGGMSAINRLGSLVGDDPRYQVLLIDRHNYHLFWPLVYQVATGGVEAGSLTYPARVIVRERGFRFLEASVESVDISQKRLLTDAGPIEYDALILAPGSVTSFFGMKDAQDNSFPLHSLPDANRLRNRVIECFESADREGNLDLRRQLLTFIVVGGGATGVELTASLRDLIFTALLPNYPSIGAEDVRVILIETHETLLSGWDPRIGAIAADRLRHQRVELMLNTSVAHVSDQGVETGSGTFLASTTVIWTAGVRAEPVVETLPGDKGRDRRVRVDECLELPDAQGVFIVGDAAAVTPLGCQRPLPPTAPVAIEGGRRAAENALRRLRGEAPEPLRYRSKGDLVSLGRGAAAASLFGIVFDGLFAWFVRRVVYLVNLVGFRNRVSIMLDWTFVTLHERIIASFNGVPKPQLKPRIEGRPSVGERRAP
jgi:NADH dehydrogenase